MCHRMVKVGISYQLPFFSIIILAITGGIDTSVTKPISGYVMFCFEITISVVGWKMFFFFIATNFSLIN